MTRHITKLAAMLFTVLLLPQVLFAGKVNAKAAEDFAQSKAMRGAKAGVCVIDMTTGEVVASLNEDTPHPGIDNKTDNISCCNKGIVAQLPLHHRSRNRRISGPCRSG